METDIKVLYGSQTGNAEDLAKRIGYHAKILGYHVLVQAMDDFPLKKLPKEKFVIFVCSTTGHGQEPENMKNFYNFVRRRDLPKGCLSNLKFAVYGLGSTSYAKFNYVSKILYKRLKECGAQPIQELVAGNEQDALGCDELIYPKLTELWSKLDDVGLGSSEARSIRDTDLLPENSYEVRLHDTEDRPESNERFKMDYIAKYDVKTAFCTTNQRITSNSHFQDTRFVCFKTESPIAYEPGDVCAILPANSDENVDEFIRILDLNGRQRFSVKKLDPNYMIDYLYDFIPDGLLVRDLVKYYLDIQSIPKRSFFEFLWPFSVNELEKDKLKEFASTEGQEAMYEYCVQPKRNILEVLLDFPHTVKNIQFKYLFDLIPPMKPRSFSIASALRAHPNEIQLIIGVVNYQTKLLKKPRKGLCSNYLARMIPLGDQEGDSTVESTLRFYIKRSSFKLPKNDSTRILMIGPGLGIAPFRSFIEDRALRANHSGANHLYFGCRSSSADFYFRDQLESYSANGILKLRVAFSRQQPKHYIQELLEEDSELVKEIIIDEDAVIYVAGNSKLPEDIRKLFEKIMSCSDDKLISRLEAMNKIQYDCW